MITFPSLNLTLQTNPIAFKIGNIDIYWYAIIITTAILIAVFVMKLNEKNNKIAFSIILDLLIYLIPICVLSARLYYIIFNPIFFINNPSQILNLRTGGIAIYGAIIGGIITCYIFCKKRNINFLDLMDYIAPSLALGQSIGRWGNFINIEAYGTETDNIFRMGIFEQANYIEVHPTFLYESILTFFIFIILILFNKKRKFRGEIIYAYFILYTFVRFFVEGLRVDSLMLYNFRISQILSLILFVIFCFLMSFKVIKYRKCNKIKEKTHTK